MSMRWVHSQGCRRVQAVEERWKGLLWGTRRLRCEQIKRRKFCLFPVRG